MTERIRLVHRGLNVAPLAWALRAHPQLWNTDTGRTSDPASPHHGCDDIWARYAAEGQEPSEPHDSVWYPAADVLPVRELVFPLMHDVRATRLGGVLITRIPTGGEVKPHRDPGWHARAYEKFAVQIEAAPGQTFCFDNETLETRPGDVFWFDNAHTHWVTNPTPYARVTMIVCVDRR